MQDLLKRLRSHDELIYLIGERFIDTWYTGKITRASQEDPNVGVFVHDSLTATRLLFDGGAGNVLASMRSFPYTHVVDCTYNGGEKIRYADKETGRLLFRIDRDRHVDGILHNDCIKAGNNVVIADYGKGLLDLESLAFLMSITKDSFVVFSPHITTARFVLGSPIIEPALENWLWVMNEEENKTLSVKPRRAIVTLGSSDTHIMEYGEIVGEVSISCVDDTPHTCGIGDVFLAAFSIAVIYGIEIPHAVQIANRLCYKTLIKNRFGTRRLDREDILDYSSDWTSECAWWQK